MTQPLLSIIIAVKNAEYFLAQALDSIVAQSFDDYQIVIIDGHCSDKSLTIARTYKKVVCIEQNGEGFLNAWNIGIAFSNTPFIAFLDSDDIWSSDKLASQMAVFDLKPEIECVFGKVRFFLEPGCKLPKGFRPELLEKSYAIPMSGTTLVKRSVLTRIDPFDERMKIAGDIAWIAQLRSVSIFDFVDKVVLNKRLHDSNLGHTTSWPLFKSELLAVMNRRIHATRSRE